MDGMADRLVAAREDMLDLEGGDLHAKASILWSAE
jgi:hypothetical protein